MNPELKTKWVSALRSGQFTQGLRRLVINEEGVTRHCCLGVLCEVADRDLSETISIFWAPDDLLPLPTQETLSNMNDRGDTFAEIADYIEEKL